MKTTGVHTGRPFLYRKPVHFEDQNLIDTLSQETRFLRIPAAFSGEENRTNKSKNRLSDGKSFTANIAVQIKP
jgi:hypothetical protein